jgi:hypothetical protein
LSNIVGAQSYPLSSLLPATVTGDLDARQTRLFMITETLIWLDFYHKNVSFFKDSSSMQGPTERKHIPTA